MKSRRKTIRIKGYDYSQAGAYFITICANKGEFFFGEISKSDVVLTDIGIVAQKYWAANIHHFKNVKLDQFVIMPNHIHGIIILRDQSLQISKKPAVGVQYIEPLRKHRYQHIIPKSIGSIIRSYKSAVTRWCNVNRHEYFRWQRNFYEHIIRSDKELERVREYIFNNPLKWQIDRENPDSVNFDIAHDDYFRKLYDN